MIRRRLVRQSALGPHSSTDSMPSPPPVRQRRNSQDSRLRRQRSTESLDLLISSPGPSRRGPDDGDGDKSRGRRHSVACGLLYSDAQRPTLRSALNCAVRRMSDACALLSSAPSSTYSLSAAGRKEHEVILPQVLGTFKQSMKPPAADRGKSAGRGQLLANRRFSTDPPPPAYREATSEWKTCPRQKLLTRQREVASSKGSLGAQEEEMAELSF